MRVLASLFQTVESTTPYGGISTTYEALGVAWLALGSRRRRERTEAGLTRSIEVVAAETRTDPRLIEDRVLRFGGGDWRIAEVQDAGSGRVTLNLERAR
jgi:hypothetical protein